MTIVCHASAHTSGLSSDLVTRPLQTQFQQSWQSLFIAQLLNIKRKQAVQRGLDLALGHASKVGLDKCGLDVSDDQQRPIFEGFTVLQKLRVCLVEVTLASLVLDSKMTPYQTSAQPWPPLCLATPASKVKDLFSGSSSAGIE